MPLKKYANSDDFDEHQVCGSCKYYPTKLEGIDKIVEELLAKTVKVHGEDVLVLNLQTNLSVQQIVSAIFEGFDLEDKKQTDFHHSEVLDVWQWVAIRALTNGRNQAENERDKN
ncbi:MAG TPA: hypothetical protein PKY82_33550 [Pyrinomonadaceae bacterium]|nr:hypothetical protein [Pyrinomonadaceae bacterium]